MRNASVGVGLGGLARFVRRGRRVGWRSRVNVTGPVEVKDTGTWAQVHIPHVRLIAGDQYMKVFSETDGVNIKSILASRQV